MNDRDKEYVRRKNKYLELAKKQEQKVNFISNIRILVFILGVGAIVYFMWFEKYIPTLVSSLIFLITFGHMVKIHQAAKEKQRYYAVMADINADALKRRAGKWTEFKDNGEDFADEEHPYGQDLDIFGSGSLFQWINCGVTYWGRQCLGTMLTEPTQDIKELYKKQKAIQELSQKLDWRQNFLAEGRMLPGEIHDPEKLCKWAETPNEFYSNKALNIAIKVLPITTVTLFILYFLSIINWFLPIILVALQIAILGYRGKERAIIFDNTYTYRNNLNVYSGLFKSFENETFRASYIRDLQKVSKGNGAKTGYFQIKKLGGIVDSISNRNNQFYMIINILTLADYQNMIRLEKWKESSGKKLRDYFKALAEMEALSSLSTINYDYPQWTFPVIVEDKAGLDAKDMGHPLLTKGRIVNDASLDKNNALLMITGSNMSGKSTFLRTIGVNLVLAYTGAPVCASDFRCSFMEVYTSMRTKDNLEKNLSSFYAELLRISMIVKQAEKASKNGTQVLFLLDEIFKGTNSADRNTGARILLKKLINEGALGLVSTHDLELGDLEKEKSLPVKNFHFREEYKDNQILFDYKLRPGVSTTKNALYLMKMVGIDLEEDI